MSTDECPLIYSRYKGRQVGDKIKCLLSSLTAGKQNVSLTFQPSAESFSKAKITTQHYINIDWMKPDDNLVSCSNYAAAELIELANIKLSLLL